MTAATYDLSKRPALNIAKENLRALLLREIVDETIVSITSRRGVPVSPAGACLSNACGK
ncbi:hypothetical protein [Paraburkholderia franconis]|uniref:hypothetical protein n=1 Tax=Paraburkholderia franconis TaxID=2654983 RepID=UPI001D128DF2|nr:hypothetical protein [Paraburkholderia franconis]